MTYFGLDLADAVEPKIGQFADSARRLLRHDLGLGESFGRCDFNFEPGAKAVFFAPNSAELRARIACDQMRLSMRMKMRTRDSKRKALSIQLSALSKAKAPRITPIIADKSFKGLF